MAEECAYNTIELENMVLEIGDMNGKPRSFNQDSDNTMDGVKMVGDEDCSVKLTEEQNYNSDIPEEQMINILEEEGVNFRLDRNILGRVIADTSLKCMAKTSSPSKENVSDNVHERRHSTAAIIGANHNFAVCSRYLCTRLTSCHDLCKPEHKKPLEDPKRRSMGTISGVTSISKVETKKKAFLRRSSLPGTVVENLHRPHISNLHPTKKDLNCLKMKRIQSETRPPWGSTSGQSSNTSKIETQAGKKIVAQAPKLQENSSQMVKEIKTMKELGSHSRGINEKAKDPMNNSISLKTPLTNKRSPSMTTNIYKNIQSISHANNQNNSKQNKTKGPIDVLKTTVYMTEHNSVQEPEKRALKASSPSKNFQNTDKSKEPKSNVSTPRVPGAPKRTLGMKEKVYKNLKGIPSPKNQNNPEEHIMITRSVDMPEKTLYMIESSSDKKPPRKASMLASSSNSLSHTKSVSYVSKTNDTHNETEVDYVSLSSTSTSNLTASIPQAYSQSQVEEQMDLDDKNTNRIGETEDDGRSGLSTASAMSTVDSNTKCESAGTSDQEEKDGSSWMVKFRTGTMVAFQAAEYSTKRHHFKSGRALGDAQNDNDEAVCLKKIESSVNHSNDTKIEIGKVILRHQEQVEKEDSLDLNIVIEETISKSKVKALVSAFETMMSLRDRKPLVQTRFLRVAKNGRHKEGVKLIRNISSY